MATYARHTFITTRDLQVKKEILMTLGSNPIIKDGKISILAEDWFQLIEKDYPVLQSEYQRLELNKMPMNKSKTEALTSVRTRWLPGSDSNRRPIG